MVNADNIKEIKWILNMEEYIFDSKIVYHCICPKCKKDVMEYIYGTEMWYMMIDNLPNYCPNCGDKKI